VAKKKGGAFLRFQCSKEKKKDGNSLKGKAGGRGKLVGSFFFGNRKKRQPPHVFLWKEAKGGYSFCFQGGGGKREGYLGARRGKESLLAWANSRRRVKSDEGNFFGREGEIGFPCLPEEKETTLLRLKEVFFIL